MGRYLPGARAPTQPYTLSLHDALPICSVRKVPERDRGGDGRGESPVARRSEEHTSELQSPYELVCRLLLEKKKWCAQRGIEVVPELRDLNRSGGTLTRHGMTQAMDEVR